MDDRELLELAAKAAGIPGAWAEEWQSFHIAEHLRGYEPEAVAGRARLGLGNGRIWWNPLIEDGDALRLAVKLRMAVSIDRCIAGVVRVLAPDKDSLETHEWIEEEDPYAATRRAIVLAAAAHCSVSPSRAASSSSV